jgi:hypothetical protein
MSEHFLNFKKAFHQSMVSSMQQMPQMPQMPQMKFPEFSKRMFGKLNNFGSIQCSKWMKVFSTGIIIYSAYFYLKRAPKYNQIQHSFSSYFRRVKKLFLQSIANGLYREKETQKNITFKVKELPEHVKYDGGWFNELDELKRRSSPFIFSKDHALLDSLRETTPRGEIVVYYCAETRSFNYYSNSKNIPYSTLDAVARKYVCLHKDPSIYIDIRDEVQKGREKVLKKNKDSKLKLERDYRNKNENGFLSSTKKSLFATFKNYKTGRNTPKSIHNYDGKVKIEEFEDAAIKDNINKFIYKGTLEQYDVDVASFNKQDKQGKRGDDGVVGNICEIVAVDNDANNADYLKIKDEKEFLSYAAFKKKYNS